MTRLLTILGLVCFLASPAAAQDIFNVVGQGHCPNPTNGVSRTLPAGIHYVNLSGGVSYWSYDSANGGKTWICYVMVKDMVTGTEYQLTSGTGFQATRALAAAEVAGMTFTFTLASAGPVRFYIADGGGCGDNRSSVTVTLDDLTVDSQTSTWGAVKSIYR